MGREFADAGTRTLAGLLSRLADDTTVEFPGARITTGVTEGMVASALASAAGPHDVLVIGSDKTGYARGRLFGLRAAQLAAASAVTVAIVPSVDLRLRTGVVVAVPDAQTGADLARIGAREAVRRGCPLTLVHATGSAGHAASSNQVLTAARRAAQGACPDLEISALIPQRHPAEAILNVSRNKALLVVGRSRTTSPLGIGTTLHEVLMNANAPTIVISADEPGTILGS
jgi:nucleotide-binding universal stress UspA family protein